MSNFLEIKNLNVSIENKQILEDINLSFNSNKISVLLGPNGAGKSSLANVLIGNPKYKVESGNINFNKLDLTKLSVNEIAKAGIFMSFQHPIEISGVTMSNFLKTSYNSVKGTNLTITEFMKILNEKLDELEMDKKFRSRFVNSGFSGGEKKRSEILQMLLLEPKFIILDEIDSGLDVDALKLIAKTILKLKEKTKCSILLISHQDKFLQYVKPDNYIVMKSGKITLQGGKEILEKVQDKGFN